MADTSNTGPSEAETTSDAEEKKVDAPCETALAHKTEGEASAETTTDSAPAHVTATGSDSKPTTAEPTDITPDSEASTVGPVTTESEAEETKAAGEEGEGSKVKETDFTPRDPTPTKTAFDEFEAKLAEILKEVDHDEMWGVKLVTPVSTHISTQIVLQKFLNANDGELPKAVDQLKGALKFRKEKKPLELIQKTFSAKKFADLGAVTVYPVKGSTVPDVFTWNLYGNVKGKMEEVFAPLDEYAMMSYL